MNFEVLIKWQFSFFFWSLEKAIKLNFLTRLTDKRCYALTEWVSRSVFDFWKMTQLKESMKLDPYESVG